jgi:hypothetical protein
VRSLIDTSVLVGARDVGELTDDWAVSVVPVGALEAGIPIAGDDATHARRVADEQQASLPLVRSALIDH